MNKLIGIILLFSSTFILAQNVDRPVTFSTNFHGGFYHLASYSKERSSFYLEQEFNYNITPRFSLAAQVGINLYPALLAFPISFSGHYQITDSDRPLVLTQSIGRNLNVGDIFYTGNRYWGSIGMTLNNDQNLKAIPDIGYSFLWDQYGGKSLTFFVGIRLTY